MAVFKYTAVDSNGSKISGEHEANTKDSVARFLHEQNYVIVSIDEKVDYFEEIFSTGNPKVSLKNRVIFAKQIATMLAAGLPITQALEIVIQQTTDKALERNMQAVLDDIQKNGVALSDAMQKHTQMFNQVQISLIKAGEASGNLVEILDKVAIDLDKTKKIKSKIQNAMIYPVIVFAVIIVVMVVMMTSMIPAVRDLYNDFKIDKLPAVTAFLVAISDFVTTWYGSSSLLLVLVSSILGFRYYRGTSTGRFVTDKYFLKIPVFGNLIAKVQIAEFCRLISMLLKSGIPIVEGLDIVSSALSNVLFQNSIQQAIEDIKKGIPLAVPLSKSEVFPPLIVRMVGIGEETGKLDSVLADMAKFYDDEVEEISENLNKLMEPIILIIVGAIVAFLAIGIYLPIYSIGQNIS